MATGFENEIHEDATAFVARREKVYIWANVMDVAMTLLRNGIAYVYLIWQTLEQGLPASEFLLYFYCCERIYGVGDGNLV